MTQPITWKTWLDANELTSVVLCDLPVDSPTLAQEWEHSPQDKAAAWPFLIELRSRVVTRTLEPRSGDERAALDSVYQLFPTYRRLAEANPGCTRFATLALDVLDRYVRPFTARWHKKSMAGRLDSMDESAQFRVELRSVQENLRRTLKLFALLADVKAASVLCDLKPPPTIALDPLELAPVSADANLEAVFQSERQAIARRRGLLPRAVGTPPDRLFDGVGLALSGGGIRSATFSLGVVAQLSHRGVLDQVDYLSTVSGGGYLGAFISALLGQTNPKETTSSIFGTRGAGDTPTLRALRNHSRYLIEGGVRTILSFLGLMLSGITASLIMVVPVLAALTLLVGDLNNGRTWIDHHVFWIATIVFFMGFGAILLAQRLWTRGENWIAQGWIVALLAIFYLWLGSRPWSQWITTIDRASWTGIVTVTSVVLIALLRSPSPQSKGLLGLVVWLAGPLLLLEAAIITQLALSLNDGQLLGAIAVGFAVTFLVNLNVASPHRFYRDRVARTYILKTQTSGEPVIPAELRLGSHAFSLQEMSDAGVSEGDGAYVLGFPLGLVDPINKHVIVRSAIISRIRDAYSDQRRPFLVDANIFPGNSGGPVLTRPEAMAITGTVANTRAQLIGIVRAYLPYADVAVSQQTRRARVIFEENSGLAYVEPIDRVRELIDALFARRTPPAVAVPET